MSQSFASKERIKPTRKRHISSTSISQVDSVSDEEMELNSILKDSFIHENAETSARKAIPLKSTNGVCKGLQTSSQTKKITIKNFQSRSNLIVWNLDTSWALLENSILKIFKLEKASATGEELYATVSNLCHKNFGPEIYSRLKCLIEKHTEAECLLMIERNRVVDYHAFLNDLSSTWEMYCQQLLLIRSIFLYLDRTYKVQNSSFVTIWDMGLDAFRSNIVCSKDIGLRLTKGLMTLIENDRVGTHVNRLLLKTLLKMLLNLKIYEQRFEIDFLAASKVFYEAEAKLKAELEIGSYLSHIRLRISEETQRVEFYLEYSTSKRVINIIEKCFIEEFSGSIISKGLIILLDERFSDISLMYELLLRIKDGTNMLKIAFSEQIKKIGKTLIMDTDRDKTFVLDLMKLKSNLDDIISMCFQSNEKFTHALKDAFEYFINIRPNKPAELIAKFMDAKLRTGNKQCSEEELESIMDRAIMLFRFVQGKDVFEAFYKKDLAKRLLLGRSASVDAEKLVLFKLRMECGAALTQKMEGMFKDMELSREFNTAFKQYLTTNDKEGKFSKVEFGVNTLTMGNWPNYPITEVNIPSQLAELQQMYTKFYTNKHNSRRLQWQYSLSSAILKARISEKVVKELDVSLFQAMVLLLFNDKTEWTYVDVFEQLKIDHPELKRTLQSLACGKHRILHKEPRGKDVDETDKFVLNVQFDDRLYRIRISQIQMRETEQEHKQTEEQVFSDRQYQIDAAIVRIMKMRKKLSHNLLISELFNQLRFPAKSIDLKKRIESLIEREYMARDKNDPQLYNYVA